MSDTGIFPVGDAYNHSSENYPYNVQPQLRAPTPQGPKTVLKCPPDTSLQSIVFDGSNLAVIRGWQWKSKMELKDFFMPCNGFLEMEILLPNINDGTRYHFEAYHNTEDTFITINYGLLQNVYGNISFVALFPQYQNVNETDQTKWKLNMRFQGETEWKELGRLFIWSSTPETGVPPIEIQNNMSDDVYLKILIAN